MWFHWKKRAAMGLGTLALSVFLLAVPALLAQSAAYVELVRPGFCTLSEDIYVNGEVEETIRKEVTLSLPVVAGNVWVSVGDWVEVNQPLAEVDIPATSTALLQLAETLELLPSGSIAAMAGLTQGLPELTSEESLSLSSLENLLPRQILAPASGVVTSLELSPGTLALPQSAVCTISRLEGLRLKMWVEETWAEQVAPGDQVLFKAGATGEETYAGTVTSVFPTASKTLVGASQQTVVGLYVSVDTPAPRLRPGYTVRGVVRKGAGEQALLAPYEAIRQDEDGQEYLYVWEQGRAVRRKILTGGDLTSGAAVIQGLSAEDFIITDASSVPEDGCLAVVRQPRRP